MKFIFCSAMIYVFHFSVLAQNEDRIKLFLNCDDCDHAFIKTEITWVDYVRDIKDADVVLLVMSIETGSGGDEFKFEFTGQHRFEGIDDVHKYSTSSIVTFDEERNGIVQTIKLGLLHYASHLPMALEFSINWLTDKEEGATGSNPEDDPWNSWVFSLGANGNISGQKISQDGSVSANISASQVTEKHKWNFGSSSYYSESRYSYSGTTDVYIQRGSYFDAGYVQSLGGKLSAGLFYGASRSDYSNTDFANNVSAAIEYDFFPYSEAQTRLLTWSYRIGAFYRDYHEMTIYNKREETVPNHHMSLAYSMTKPWGSISFALSGSTFLDQIARHRYGGYTNFDVRIFKGLSMNAFFTYDVIHDQIGLPAGGASDEEVLLQQQELATSYSFFSYFGLSYRFGSIYNNVVNPRFDSGSMSFSF